MNASDLRRITEKAHLLLMEQADLSKFFELAKAAAERGLYSITYAGLSVGQMLKLQSLGFQIGSETNLGKTITWTESSMW